MPADLWTITCLFLRIGLCIVLSYNAVLKFKFSCHANEADGKFPGNCVFDIFHDLTGLFDNGSSDETIVPSDLRNLLDR